MPTWYRRDRLGNPDRSRDHHLITRLVREHELGFVDRGSRVANPDQSDRPLRIVEVKLEVLPSKRLKRRRAG